jgi:phosphatidylinositol alpha-1,6-mannosyltransferase
VTRTLVVTNDFPPRPGGIQSFVQDIVTRLPPEDVVVYASRWPGWADYDAATPFAVVREDTKMLLPTPAVTSRAAQLVRAERCDAVLFGAAAPLGLMAPALRAAGAGRIVGLTHGHEAAWAGLPVARQLLRRIGDRLDVVTYLGEYTRRRIASALSRAAAARMVQLPPGVDDTRFRPGVDGAPVRERLGWSTDRPVVVCVSRLVPRKGQDALLGAWPAVLRRVPSAGLLLVGGGPYRKRLEGLADQLAVRDSVAFTGSVPWPDLPAYFAAGDVFAMPCRTRRGGLDVEGLGIVYLEASASGLPVVAGDSGGAPDAVLDGETGYVVPGRSPSAVADRLSGLLLDRLLAERMGKRGRQWVEERWRWDDIVARLRVSPHEKGRGRSQSAHALASARGRMADRSRSRNGTVAVARRHGRAGTLLDLIASVLEHVLDETTKGEDHENDQGRDRRHQQAVFDRRCAVVPSLRVDKSAQELKHWKNLHRPWSRLDPPRAQRNQVCSLD